MNTDILLKLIYNFQSRVQLAITLFDIHLGLKNVMYWRQAKIPIKGFLDKEKTMPYYFHGSGCCLKTPEGEIDWDFGDRGRFDGFDLWRLKKFVNNNKGSYPDFEDDKILSQTFEFAIKIGIIKKDITEQAGHLYYLVPV